MPLLKRLSTSISKKWSQRKERRSTKDASLRSSTLRTSAKKSVRFDLWPQLISSSYIVTEDIQNDMWYQQKDFIKMQTKVEEITNKAAVDFGSLAKSECHRGLESAIRNKVNQRNRVPTSRNLHSECVRGLVELQKRQQLSEGSQDEEQIRHYCRGYSQKKQAVAQLLAARDALCASRIYENSDDWSISTHDTTKASGSPQKRRDTIRRICRKTSLPTTLATHRRGQ